MYETISDINIKYAGEWVYLIDCKVEASGQVLGGTVVLHSPDRDCVIRDMEKYELYMAGQTYFRYAGKISEGGRVVL